MLAAVSSRLEACSSVRCERSVVPAATCIEALATLLADARTLATTSASDPFIRPSAPTSWPGFVVAARD